MQAYPGSSGAPTVPRNPHTRQAYSEAYYEIQEDVAKLPATACKDTFLKLLFGYRVIIVDGATGSGKSTQIPKFCMQAGLKVVCTQPRRLAARKLAARVAEELDVVGVKPSVVGYQVRYEKTVEPETKLSFVTEGILLNQERELGKYGAIVVDEAHERSTNTDLVLAILKRHIATPGRTKIIIMSATINTELFVAYFEGAVYMFIPGRTFPVDIAYQRSLPELAPPGDDDYDEFDDGIISVVKSIHHREAYGDILVFLSGEKEISETVKELRRVLGDVTAYNPSALRVFPLYSNLPKSEQDVIFKESDCRKCIVATNVAETSITIPNIVYVVDSGFCHQKFYDPTTRIERLIK